MLQRQILSKKLSAICVGCWPEYWRPRRLTAENICFIHFFCSDICNQIPALEKLWPRTDAIQRIYIGQQPLDSAHLSMQVYCLAEIYSRQIKETHCLYGMGV